MSPLFIVFNVLFWSEFDVLSKFDVLFKSDVLFEFEVLSL